MYLKARPFAKIAWEKAKPIYEAMIAAPFNQELMRGELPQVKFQFYLQQDTLYLKKFSQSLSLIASRCQDEKHANVFFDCAKNTLPSEEVAVHDIFAEKNKPAVVQPTVACDAYTNYLLHLAEHEPVEIAIASSIPCPWVYFEVAHYMATFSKADNPYSSWITFYSSEEFKESVIKVVDVFEALATKASNSLKEKMLEAFYQSCLFERSFWQDAYICYV